MDNCQVIGEIPITTHQIIRVQTGEFRRKPRIDIRQYFLDDDDTFRPSQRGVAVPMDEIDKLLEFIQKAKETI